MSTATLIESKSREVQSNRTEVNSTRDFDTVDLIAHLWKWRKLLFITCLLGSLIGCGFTILASYQNLAVSQKQKWSVNLDASDDKSFGASMLPVVIPSLLKLREYEQAFSESMHKFNGFEASPFGSANQPGNFIVRDVSSIGSRINFLLESEVAIDAEKISGGLAASVNTLSLSFNKRYVDVAKKLEWEEMESEARLVSLKTEAFSLFLLHSKWPIEIKSAFTSSFVNVPASKRFEILLIMLNSAPNTSERTRLINVYGAEIQLQQGLNRQLSSLKKSVAVEVFTQLPLLKPFVGETPLQLEGGSRTARSTLGMITYTIFGGLLGLFTGLGIAFVCRYLSTHRAELVRIFKS